MTSVDVNLSTYIDYNKKNKKERPKFDVGDHLRISNFLKKWFCKRLCSKLIWRSVITKVKKYCAMNIRY